MWNCLGGCAVRVIAFATSDSHKLLGRMSDRQVAQRLGCAYHQADRQRKRLGIPSWRPLLRWKPRTAAEDKLVGTMPDQELAGQIGRTRMAVCLRRGQLGLAPLNPKWKSWTREEMVLLGIFRDEEIAARTGHSAKGRRLPSLCRFTWIAPSNVPATVVAG
jgi:hypothetical protein